MNKVLLRFESLCIASTCLLVAFFRGSSKQHTLNEKDVVLVINLTSNIGDMVCTTGLINALKRKIGVHKVLVVGYPHNGEILSGHKDIDVFIPYSSFLQTLLKLLKEKPSVALALNQSVHEAGLGYLSSSASVGVFSYEEKKNKLFNFIKKLFKTILYTPGNYVPNEYLKLLSLFGHTVSTSDLTLAVDPGATRLVQKELARNNINPKEPFILLAPTAGQTFKEWPTEYFGKFIQHLWKVYKLPTVLTASIHEKKKLDQVAKHAGDALIYNALGQNLKEMKATVAMSSVVISNDSGVAQVGRALNTPTFVIVGVTYPFEHHSRDKKNWYITTEHQHPVIQSHVSGFTNLDTKQAKEIMRSIKPEVVISTFTTFWEKLSS